MGMFQVTGAQLHVRSTGDGPPVIQLHGLTSRASRERAAGLDMTVALTGVRTLHIDARAHGESTGRPNPEDYVWPQLAEDLLQVLDVVAPGERVTAAGPSMGAATLLYAALEDPGRFSSLTLLATLLLMQPRIQLAFWAVRAHCWLIVQLAVRQYS